jgi:antitoxin component HigA of HigAB toxin-antitoxin module
LTVNYNSQTGLHRVIIDTSVTTSPTGFYGAGNDYFAVITTGTVNGTSVVGVEVASFSIGNRTTAPTTAAIQAYLDANSTKLANLDAAVSTRLASSSYTAPTTPPTAAAIRTEMDSNSTKLANLDAAVSTRLASSAYTAAPTVSAIQSGLALHTDVTTIESQITALGSPMQASSYVAPTTPPTVVQIRQEMDTNSTKLSNLDAAVSTRLASSSYTAPTTPPTVAAIRTEMDSNSTKLANLDAAVSTRLASSSYTAPPTVGAIQSGLALHSDVVAIETTLATMTGLLGGGGGGTIIVSSFTDSALLSMRQNLTGAVVTVTGPVTYEPGKGLLMRLTIGDDYSATDSRAIQFDLDGTTLPDLTTASVSLVCELSGKKRSQVAISGEITVATGTTRTVRFQPAAADTLQLSPTVEGEFYTVITLAGSGRVITPLEARGRLIVLMGKRPIGT